ncbi:hypothetical protein CC85DRAFT_284326 [Cutaneotrichosporon oleaginosum]|uniref:Uncharacterized protein n=1 Tax=Cutaneotrichosporon oleaginosum TaxID=879819 RepID=A0A0J0XRC8_9TREE|nr:uncharacterized protein CC85DRAFT_284326 [Cutaneotrichosporon oleaginosum]KLT43617.1 hypothetical protein CC85DRAFT_284326 [Cutaneotrichosporon oleaginosum]TXT12715.1 hypothetical protein COLE_03125 [Cutaneotrichosporon oleaginosum]
MISTSTALLAASLLASEALADRWCRDRWTGRVYRCNGLSTGARIAIGVCVGVGVFLLFLAIGLLRRRKLQAQWNRYRPPPPVGMAAPGGYSNNPPPPTYATGGAGGFRSDSGVDSPAPPPATYQPSSAGQYGMGGGNSGYYGNDNSTHNYEYEQQARMDAEKNGGAQSPPGYNVESAGPNLYAPPSGPPPAAGTGNYASPTGPPPGR